MQVKWCDGVGPSDKVRRPSVSPYEQSCVKVDRAVASTGVLLQGGEGGGSISAKAKTQSPQLGCWVADIRVVRRQTRRAISPLDVKHHGDQL